MANLITLLRFPLLFVYVALLYYGNFAVRAWCVPFIIAIIVLDSVDGIVARARGEVSLLGSALDIATDRTLEVMLWVVFAHLGLIPIVVPLIFIVRGTLVDALRAVGMGSGKAPFEQVRSPVSRFLVASRFMRASFGTVKTFAFALLTADLALQTPGAPWPQWQGLMHGLALLFTWASVAWSLARGLPVIAESVSLLREPSARG